MNKLVTAAPSSELVNAYLTEIAKAYGVPWSADSEIESEASKEEVRKTETSRCPLLRTALGISAHEESRRPV